MYTDRTVHKDTYHTLFNNRTTCSHRHRVGGGLLLRGLRCNNICLYSIIHHDIHVHVHVYLTHLRTLKQLHVSKGSIHECHNPSSPLKGLLPLYNPSSPLKGSLILYNPSSPLKGSLPLYNPSSPLKSLLPLFNPSFPLKRSLPLYNPSSPLKGFTASIHPSSPFT